MCTNYFSSYFEVIETKTKDESEIVEIFCAVDDIAEFMPPGKFCLVKFQ